MIKTNWYKLVYFNKAKRDTFFNDFNLTLTYLDKVLKHKNIGIIIFIIYLEWNACCFFMFPILPFLFLYFF